MTDQPRCAAPILCVTSVAESIDFYERALGFTRLRYFDGNDEYIVLAHGEAQIHLLAAPRANPNHAHAAHGADAFIWVETLGPVVGLASAAGLVAVRGPERYDSSPVATEEVVYPDPDDHWICFGAVVG